MCYAMLRIYTLSNCDTCRAATKWLRSRGVAFEEIAIRETPPKLNELRAALALLAGNGNLVKRPFLIGDNLALVGFNEKTWAAEIAAK